MTKKHHIDFLGILFITECHHMQFMNYRMHHLNYVSY